MANESNAFGFYILELMKFKSNRTSIQCEHTSGVSKTFEILFGRSHSVVLEMKMTVQHQMNETEMELICKKLNFFS